MHDREIIHRVADIRRREQRGMIGTRSMKVQFLLEVVESIARDPDCPLHMRKGLWEVLRLKDGE